MLNLDAIPVMFAHCGDCLVVHKETFCVQLGFCLKIATKLISTYFKGLLPLVVKVWSITSPNPQKWLL